MFFHGKIQDKQTRGKGHEDADGDAQQNSKRKYHPDTLAEKCGDTARKVQQKGCQYQCACVEMPAEKGENE